MVIPEQDHKPFVFFLFQSFLVYQLFFHILIFFYCTHSFVVPFTLHTVFSSPLQLIGKPTYDASTQPLEGSYTLQYILPTQLKLVATLVIPLVGSMVGLSCPECPSGSRNSLCYHKASQAHNITCKVSFFSFAKLWMKKYLIEQCTHCFQCHYKWFHKEKKTYIHTMYLEQLIKDINNFNTPQPTALATSTLALIVLINDLPPPPPPSLNQHV